MSPPSTACSASTECGGVRISSWRMMATIEPGSLLFGDHRERHRNVDVTVQVQRNRVFADRADRPARQAHFSALDGVAGLEAGLRDVRRADRPEQLAFVAGLGRDAEREALERCRPRLRRRELRPMPWTSSSARRLSNLAMFSGVASVALPPGSR